MTLLASWQLQRSNQAHIRTAVEGAAETTATAVLRRITLYQYGLRGARGAIVSVGDAQITREAFSRYSQTRDVKAEFPGAHGFGFIRRVAATDEARFVAQARADGMPDYTVRQLEPHSAERYLIQYIEPAGPNRASLGLDIASEQNRRVAALAALQTGQVKLTGPITLVQATGSPLQSFLILMPVYKNAITPATQAAREANAVGWAYAPLIMSELMARVAIDKAAVELQLHDITESQPGELFYASSDERLQPVSEFSQQLILEVFGRRWLVGFSVKPLFIQRLHLFSPLLALLIGACVTALLAALVGVLSVSRRRRLQVIGEQARLAAIVENSSEAIVSLSRDGVVTSWNRGAEQLFGIKAEAALGRKEIELIYPSEYQVEALEVLERVTHDERVPSFDTQRLREDGSLVEVSVTASVVRDAEGRVIGVSKTMRDISLNKEAEKRILELNLSLEEQVNQRTEELTKLNSLIANVLRSASEVSIIATDVDGVIQLFNAGAETLLGYRADELVGRSSPAVFHVPEEISARSKELSEHYAEPIEGFRTFVHVSELEGAESREWTYVRKDGQRFPVTLVVSAMHDDHGNISGYLGIAVDTTQRKQAEHELAASLATTRAVLNTAVNPIITINSSGIVQSFNPAGEQVFGYSRDEVVGRSITQLMPGTELDKQRQELLSFVHPDRPQVFGVGRDIIGLRKDGQSFPMQVSVGSMLIEGQRMYVGIISDMTEQQQRQQELRAARDLLVVASEVAGLGVWSWSLEDDTLKWNDSMFTLYDQPLSLRDNGLNYEHWRQRVHPDDIDDAVACLSRAVDFAEHYAPVFRVIHGDGEVRFVQAGGQVLRDESGRVVSVIGINRDITEQRQQEASLRQAKEQAQAANDAKSSFLANMSHEIRTPMNAVLGMLQLVQQTPLNPRQHDYIGKAQTAANSLLGLLNDILDYSKIEAGKMQLDPHVFELETLMRDLAVVLSGNQGDKDVEVMFEIEPELPEHFIGDSLRLQQVLINLAGNALKFTESGQVVVSIKPISRTAQTLTLTVAVTDTGIGISAEQLEHIFQGFTQAQASTTRRYGGTGLGLVICQRLLALMGSQIHVSSEAGKGSRFWFDVELGLAPSASTKPRVFALRETVSVLLVEDNPASAEVLQRSISAQGWHVDVVNNGMSAVAAVQSAYQHKQPYDVILMDWRMPDLDGLSAAKLIQQHSTPHNPPVIIMLTAYGREVLADAQDADNPPFVDFLTKPVTPQQLFEVVQRALLQPQALSTQPARTSPAVQPLAGVHLLVVEDNALNREVAYELLRGQGAEVALADCGLEGVSAVLSAQRQFDAVFMDIQMPDIDGFEATRRIRADSRFSDLPIIALTANASTSDHDACIAAGMNAHLAKPIDLQHLLETLFRLTGCNDLALLTSDQQAGQVVSDELDDRLTDELADIRSRFGDSLEVFGRVLATYHCEELKLLDELASAVGVNDTAGALAALHSIKGSSATMGAQRLSRRIAALELEVKSHPQALPQTLSRVVIAELDALLSESVGQLQQFFNQASASVARSSAVRRNVEWQPSVLNEILQLLESGNLLAVEKVDALALPHRQSDLAQFEVLVAQVEQLDFPAAAATLRVLLRRV